MTKAERGLSKRASALLARVRSGKWYNAYTGKPAAMQELLDTGLVEIQMRVKVIEACFVPKGTTPCKFERFPQRRRTGGEE